MKNRVTHSHIVTLKNRIPEFLFFTVLLDGLSNLEMVSLSMPCRFEVPDTRQTLPSGVLKLVVPPNSKNYLERNALNSFEQPSRETEQ